MCRLEDTFPPKSLGNLSESLKALAEKCVLDPSRESPLPEVGSLFAIPVCRASHRDICGLATDACTSHVTVRATRRTRGEEASGIRACLDRRHLLPLVLPPSPEPPSLLSSVHLLHSCPTSSDTASPFQPFSDLLVSSLISNSSFGADGEGEAEVLCRARRAGGHADIHDVGRGACRAHCQVPAILRAPCRCVADREL